MAIQLKLTDSMTTATLLLPEVPLIIADSNNDVKNRTIGNDLRVFIYPGADKYNVSHTWKYMRIDEYNVIRGFRARQRTSGNFPLLSITGLNEDILDMPVNIDMKDKLIIDNCETLENVSVLFEGA